MQNTEIMSQINKEYEKIALLTKDYAVSVNNMDDYHATLDRIKLLRGKLSV